jgi:hypothetical protein
MPHFRTEDRPDGSIRVTYVSERAGLAPFVLGVLEGIGAMYGEMIEVRQVEDRAAGAEHDVFLVTFPAAAG